MAQSSSDISFNAVIGYVKQAVKEMEAYPFFKQTLDAMGSERVAEYEHDACLLVIKALSGDIDREAAKAGLESTFIFHVKSDQLFIVDLADVRVYSIPHEAGDIIHYGSIALEAVFLIVGCFGVRAKVSQHNMEKMASTLGEEIIKSPQLKELVAKLTASVTNKRWKDAAVTIFKLLNGLGAGKMGTVVWNVLKESMKWYDWLVSGIGLVATILATITTGGTALIASLVAVLADSTQFILKCTKHQEVLALTAS